MPTVPPTSNAPDAPANRAHAPFAPRRRRGWRTLMVAALLTLPVIVFGSARVIGWTGADDSYTVSVPIILRPYDPALWSMVNANTFADAQAIDPALPNPLSVPVLAEATLIAAPTTLPTRLETYTGPAARPYIFRGATATDTARAHYCLTAALYYEAASETDDGMRGVAQVILNRSRHPSFPGSICGVVFQGSQRPTVCQFTFACDGSMARSPARGPWSRASRIAAEALSGRAFAPVGLATHYHTLAVWPSWGRSLATTNVIGAHIFHRWRGRYGTPGAFLRPYSGREPAPGPYLPIAQQLAARNGRAVIGTSDPAGAATIDQATMAAIEAARASAGTGGLTVPGTAPGAAPVTAAVTAAVTGPGATAHINPGVTPPVRGTLAPPPTYNDPRLTGSGSVRDEYRNSGTVITR